MIKNIQTVLNLKDRRVLVRVDWNVPLGKDGVIDTTEDMRIEKSLETLRYLMAAGARVIVISHIGRDRKDSLKPVADYVGKLLPIRFIPTLERDAVRSLTAALQPGEIVLLENLRQDPGEESNDESFASFLASLADMYVNEAFSVSHRSHASIVGIPQYLESYAGFWLQKEIEHLSHVITKPARPFLFILGGAKFDTKIDLIKKFGDIADQIFIGGALANNFFKTIGFNIGKSLVDPEAHVTPFFHKENIKIPFDVIVRGRGPQELSTIKDDDVIVDIGPNTLDELVTIIPTYKTILWNGPLGIYEDGFDVGSKKIIEAIASSGSFSVIGGGDTVELVQALHLSEKISFLSTGGGAMLEFLSTGTLPGIAALDQ